MRNIRNHKGRCEDIICSLLKAEIAVKKPRRNTGAAISDTCPEMLPQKAVRAGLPFKIGGIAEEVGKDRTQRCPGTHFSDSIFFTEIINADLYRC